MKRLIFFIFWVLALAPCSAAVYIQSVLPNTVDDANLEYVELRNTGCEEVDIDGWKITDASPKSYILPTTRIPAKSNITLPRTISKIILNNTDESLAITSSSGTMIDSWGYATSVKWEIIHRTLIDDVCMPLIEDNSSGSTLDGADTTTSWSSSESGTIQPKNNNSASGAISISGSTSDSWSSTNTDSIETQTGACSTGSTLPISEWTGSDSSSGVIIDIPHTNTEIGWTSTWAVSTQSGVLFSGTFMARSLSYADVDADGYIDHLIIDYNELLTGSINTGSILLYSATGGLYVNHINTQSGYILSGSLSGSSMILMLKPTEVVKSRLKISNTTSSELRLKTNGNIGVTTLAGQPLEPLFLTTSFTEYKDIIHPNPLLPSYSSGSSSTDQNVVNSSSWWVLTQSGISNSTLSGTVLNTAQTGSTASGSTESMSWVMFSGSMIEFPDIIPIFQNYTNTTLSGDTLTCTISPCRLNLTLEPIFTGGFISKNYICEVRYGTEVYDCNPPQLYLSGTNRIEILLIHKKSAESKKCLLNIEYQILSPQSNPEVSKKDTNPPIIKLKYDGKLHSYHEPIGEYEMNCHTDTCAINLTAEDSYDSEGGKIRYLWIYEQNQIKTSKDPGEHKYGFGEHAIELRVIDEAGNFSSVLYRVHVLGPREKEETKTEKVKKVSKEKTAKTEKQKRKKVKKMKPMKLFDPPTVILQKSKFEKTDRGYICYTTTKSCSLNLALSGTTKGIIYTWDYGNGVNITGVNPKARSYTPWVYTIRLVAGYTPDAPIWSEELQIQVIKTTKPKKPKVIKPPKTKIQKVETKLLSWGESIQTEEATLPYLPLLLLIGWLSPLMLLRRQGK